MQFSELLDSMTLVDGVWTLTVPDSWLQGRSVYGGLQAAIAVRAMRQHVPNDLPLRALQTTFVAPVPAGTVRAQARLLRTGKNTAHVEARLVHDGATAALVVGVFGSSRPSGVRVVPERDPLDTSQVLVRPAGMPRPNFVQHFDIRWVRGGLPFSGSASREATALIGMPSEETTTVIEHVLAIADVVPPVAFTYLDAPARGSSVTWTLEMLTESVSQFRPIEFRVDATLVAASNGYTSQSVTLWGPGGEAVALSRQVMVVFG